jgi:hypothetical protein
MAKFLTLREGPTAAESLPVFVSDDPALIEAVGKLISERLAARTRRRRVKPPPPNPPISLVPKRPAREDEEPR